MNYCTRCGNQVPDGVKFCTSCGQPVGAASQTTPPPPPSGTAPGAKRAQATPPPQTPYTQPPYGQPAYAAPASPAQVYTEEPISTGGYIGLFFLLMIPLVNLICLLVWACGGSAKKNKVNLSRALLVWMLIGALLSGLIFLAGSLLFGDQIDTLQELSTQMESLKQIN